MGDTYARHVKMFRSSRTARRFVCAQCRRDKIGLSREQCVVCAAFVCWWCTERHAVLHPPETSAPSPPAQEGSGGDV